MTFAPVDLATPWIAYWGAGVSLVVGVCLVGAGRWRALRQRRYAESTGRNVDLGIVQDARTQERVGLAGLVLAGALVGFGVWTHLTGLDHLRDNLTLKYGYADIDHIRQSGSGFAADLTLPDGTVLKDELVLLAPSGEPFVGEDVFIDTIGGS